MAKLADRYRVVVKWYKYCLGMDEFNDKTGFEHLKSFIFLFGL